MLHTTELNKFKLTFESNKELLYQSDQFEKNIFNLRIALVLSILLYGVFGILDIWMVPITKQSIWLVRFAFFIPLAIFSFLFTFYDQKGETYSIMSFLMPLACAMGIVVMISIAEKEEPAFDTYYNGLFLTLVWTYGLFRPSFYKSLIIGKITIIAYFLVAYIKQDLTNGRTFEFVNNLFFLISADIIGMFAGYTLENNERKNFDLKKDIEKAKLRTDELLLNILPQTIVSELKEKGVSEPVGIPDATVLFTDFVGFTELAEKSDSKKLLSDLDFYFSKFDSFAREFELEKIKTIGDSYMLAGGVPNFQKHHYIDIILAALKMRDFVLQVAEEQKTKSFPVWQIRIGIHCGPLIAGVIGKLKFAYDIFGDTVNLASRMESSGSPNKINISQPLYERIQTLFVCEFRGKIFAKRKGDIPMYFVEQIKPEYSIAGQGKSPNELFYKTFNKLIFASEELELFSSK